MARGVNKVILVGNCGQDPETKYTAAGAAVTNISIATSETWKDKETGQPQERTEWHKVVFFGRLAEIAGEYIRKGSKVYIEGSLRTRKWQDQSGQDRYSTEIVASEMQLLDSRGDNAGAPAQAPAPAPQQQAPAPAPQQAPQRPPPKQYMPAPPPQGQEQGQYQGNAQSVPSSQNADAPPIAKSVSDAPAMDSFDDEIPF